MFFSAKKLLKQKQQLEAMIQNEHKKMDAAYHGLISAFREVYCDFEYFDMFDITTVDYWFGDVACCYDGDNFDLSNALFKMNQQLHDVEAEAITKHQLMGIYNIFAILINDLYFCKEPILTQDDIPQHLLLDRFGVLTHKLIDNLTRDPSASAAGLCRAIQKLYTLLDFSLCESPKHQHLRYLQKQFLEAQAKGYDNIEKYDQEIDKINRQLEKHNYSEDGEKLSQKEFEPFPTLKAYNNAMKLLAYCSLIVKEYEKGSNPLIPSCEDEIRDSIFEQLIRSKDEFDEWDDTVDYERVAHVMLAHTTFDMLASGRYHLYAGLLDPLNCSANLMLIYDKAMAYGVEIGMVTKAEKEEQRNYLLKCISEIG